MLPSSSRLAAAPAHAATRPSSTRIGRWSDRGRGRAPPPDALQAAREDAVDAVPRDRAHPGHLGVADVEVAAEDERRIVARPRVQRVARPRDVAHRPRARLLLGVDVRRPQPDDSRTACIERRSGRHRSRTARCSSIRSPRTRIAFEPPPPDLMRSGHAIAIARRATEQLVAARQHHPHRRATRARPAAGHHGGTSCSSATSQSHPRDRRLELRVQVAPGRRQRPAVEEIPGEDLHTPRLATALPHRRRARRATSCTRSSSARRAEGRSARRRGRSRAGPSRSSSRSRRRARGCRSRPGVFELGGHPLVLRSGELQVSRGESLRDTALRPRRHVAAIGIRTGPGRRRRGARRAQRRARCSTCSPPATTRSRSLADLLTLREAFGALDGLKLAYVGDGNNVARSLAIVGAQAGVEVAIASPARLPARGRRPGDADRGPGRGGRRRARGLRRRLGLAWATTRHRRARAAARSRRT